MTGAADVTRQPAGSVSHGLIRHQPLEQLRFSHAGSETKTTAQQAQHWAAESQQHYRRQVPMHMLTHFLQAVSFQHHLLAQPHLH